MAAAERVAKDQIDQDNELNAQASDGEATGAPTPARNRRKGAGSRNAKQQ